MNYGLGGTAGRDVAENECQVGLVMYIEINQIMVRLFLKREKESQAIDYPVNSICIESCD